MQKIISIIIVCLLITCNTKAQNGYTLKGTLEGYKGEIRLQRYVDGEVKIVQSTQTNDGTFQIAGEVELPEIYYLTILLDGKAKYTSLFIENSPITIQAKAVALDQAQVLGSKTHNDHLLFNAKLKEYDNRLSEISGKHREAKNAGNETKKQELELEYNTINTSRTAYIKQLVKENPKSVAAAFIAYSQLITKLDYKELDELVSSFDESIKNAIYVKKMSGRVEILKNASIGSQSPDFTLNDPEGTPLTMSSLKGKYLLIDFWASWCGPCRHENPNVVKLYNEYKNKGLEILSVSLDNKEENWKNAIEKDQLNWKHVSDLQGWKSSAAKLYGVTGIPHTVLLDKNGVIIAKNLRGEALRKKVSELLD